MLASCVGLRCEAQRGVSNIDDVTARLANKMLASCVGLRSEAKRGGGIIDDVTARLANKMLAPCVGLRSEAQRGVGILMTSQQDWPMRCSLRALPCGVKRSAEWGY